MIHVLFFSDRDVKRKLFALVESTQKPLLVAPVPPHQSGSNPARREPFVSLERKFGDDFDQVLVVDDGKIEGMWRDPVGDLVDAVYPARSRAAQTAARHFFFVLNGRGQPPIHRQQKPADDAWAIQAAAAMICSGVPKPAGKAPTTPSRTREARAPRSSRRRTTEVEALAADAPQADQTAWKTLGLAPGATFDEAKKAFKALRVQYHPDKVAHLPIEFQQLAETKTRELIAAWEVVEKSFD